MNELIVAHPFATVVAFATGGLTADHVPLVLKSGSEKSPLECQKFKHLIFAPIVSTMGKGVICQNYFLTNPESLCWYYWYLVFIL